MAEWEMGWPWFVSVRVAMAGLSSCTRSAEQRARSCRKRGAVDPDAA